MKNDMTRSALLPEIAHGYADGCITALERLRVAPHPEDKEVALANSLSLFGRLLVFHWAVRSEEEGRDLARIIDGVRSKLRATLDSLGAQFDPTVAASLRRMIDPLERALGEADRGIDSGDFLERFDSMDFNDEVLEVRDVIHFALKGLTDLGREVPESVGARLGPMDQSLRLTLPRAVEALRIDGQKTHWRKLGTSAEMWWRPDEVHR